MITSIVTSPALVSIRSTNRAAARRRARPNFGTVTVAKSSGSGAEDAATVSAGTLAPSRRGALRGLAGALIAGVALNSPAPAQAKKANRLSDLSQITLSESEQAYQQSTLNLIAQTSALVQGRSKDVSGWLTSSDEWYSGAKTAYSPKSQGRSFLMTTKLVAYLKNSFATLDGAAEFDPANPPFDPTKTAEWIQYAEGFTSGALAGDEARAAFAKATWGNYDKSAPLNRFGLCAFGETGGTKALGVNCDGY